MPTRSPDQNHVNLGRFSSRVPRVSGVTAAIVGGISLGAGMLVWFLIAGKSTGPTQQAHGQISFDVSPAGDSIVFSAGDGDLYTLNLQTERVQRLTASSERETTPRFHPDATGIVYAREIPENNGSSIFASSLSGKSVRQLTSDPNVFDSSPAYSTDGSTIVFARAHRYRPYSLGGYTWDNWDIYLMNSDGTELQRLTRQDYYSLESPTLSIDGKRVIYSAIEGGMEDVRSTLFEADATGRDPPKVSPKDRPTPGRHAAWESQPRLSADGSRTVFVSDRESPYHYDIFISASDGSNPIGIAVTNTVSRYNQNPAFTPDGKGVLFLASRTFAAGNRPVLSLWRVDSDGSNPRCIANSRVLGGGASKPAAAESK